MIKRLKVCIEALGERALSMVATLGEAFWFLISAFHIASFRRPFFILWMKQIYHTGFLSLPIIVVAAFFIGMVLGLQGYTVLVDFGSESAVGQMVALSLLRELGPVVSGLLFAGRVGSSVTAEVGLMRTTDQIEFLEMLGLDSRRYVIAPRLWAGLVALPLLTLIFNSVGILGAAWVSIDFLGVYSGAFWGNMIDSVDFADIMNSFIKSICFAILIIWIAVYQGYYIKPTAEGVGTGTTKTVVYASLAVLGFDFILTALMI